jgi:hypothetical protein
MDRQFDNEDRDALIADLAGKLLAMRRDQLAFSDVIVVRDTANSVLDYLACSEDLGRLVLGHITFEQVRDKVLADECEVEAIQEVEAMEARRGAEAAEALVDHAVWGRAAA